MRKLVISLIILILAGGAVFYLGWVQYDLPPNSYGVIFTKSHGWEPNVVRSGTFVWRWQRLLPTNLTLYAFSAEPYDSTVSVSGSLPSAENYSQFLEQSPDFSYSISLDLRFRVHPNELVELAGEEGLLPSDLDSWYERRAEGIQAAAPELVIQSMNEAVGSENATPVATLEQRLLPRLEERFPRIEFLSLVPREIRIPDIELYLQAKEIYLAALEAREDAASAAAAAQSTQAIQTEGRLQILRSYGDILDSYPVLLDYFRLQAETGSDPLNIGASQNSQ